ncbi:MAG: MarR family transcriptional regulator [Ruminococcaceae bacterium]|nr:MarR family transcriptional regulator [Oscillospiraceae bacterium]
MSTKFETVPNQNVYVVHREPVGNNFIQINKSNYSKAYRDMSKSPAALGLYIWLVGNQDKFKFAFSPQAIENQLGMARSSCHGAIRRLEELGYLVQRENSNIYDFYEVTGKKIDRKIVESEMLIFDEMPAQCEAPKAKPGEFTF